MSWSLDNPVIKCHESSQWEKYKFEETNGDILHQNTDTSKYINWNNNKFYNSAVFLNNGTYYIFIIGTMSSYFELWYSSSEDGTYFKGISCPLRQYTGDTAYWYADGAYYDNRLDIKFTYVRQCDSFETVLPIYTDWDEFLDYIKAPYTPPPVIKASGGGGGLYGGYKGNVLTGDTGWIPVKSMTFDDGSTYEFKNLPDEYINIVKEYLDTYGVLDNSHTSVIVSPRGNYDTIMNYEVTDNPLQINEGDLVSKSPMYFNQNGRVEIIKGGTSTSYSFSLYLGETSIAGSSNMITNDHGGFCIYPFVNPSLGQATFGWFATSYYRDWLDYAEITYWVGYSGYGREVHEALYNAMKTLITVDGNAGGGAGSGYIGNSLLSNKKMVGYKVPTSSDASTKTESSNTFSTAAESNKPKAGNGFCRIKFIESCWAGEEVPILWAGDQNKMTVQLSANVLLFKLYTGNDVEYVFTANTGSSIDDTDDIYVHFLIDTNLQLAKPSMIYKDGSVYSYNLEDPTDEQMADIYTWIAPGLPS